MSIANEMRRRVAQIVLVIGASLLLFGFFVRTGWGSFAMMLGAGLFAAGAIMYVSVSVVDGVPWLVRLMSRAAEPVWDGEMLHTDGDEYKVRYDFGKQGSPRFIASDVCSAIGQPPPAKDASHCGGVPLLREGEHAYFSEADVQAYLARRAVRNHAANRLLVLIRSNVLRKLEKQREDKQRYEQEQG